MNIKTTLGIFTSALLMTGCSFTDLDPSPKAVDVKPVTEKMKRAPSGMTFNIKAGDSLKDQIKKIKLKMPNKIFIDKTESNIVFNHNIKDISLDELEKIIRLEYNKRIFVRKYSERLYIIEELIDTKITSDVVKNIEVEKGYKIPNINLNINGDFTYEEIFNELRSKNINIFSDIHDEENNDFKYNKKVSNFKGNLKDFLNFLSTKERLFVNVKKDGIALKDIRTVTYDLGLPKIKINPVLTPQGGQTAITISGTTGVDMNSFVQNSTSETNDGTSYTSNNNNNNNQNNNQNNQNNQNNNQQLNNVLGTDMISPLDDLQVQLDSLLKDNVKVNINGSNGTLSVVGDYETIRIVNKLMKDFHEIYSKAIMLEFHVYNVTLKKDLAFGIDYNLLKNELVGGEITKSIDLATNLSGALTTPVNKSSFSNFSGTIISPSGKSAPEVTQSVIFNHLNQFGKAVVVTKPTLGTINNIPVKLDVVNSIDYVYTINQQAIDTTNQNVSNVTSTVEPEIRTVTTGFSLVLQPRIIPQTDSIKIAVKQISSELNRFIDYTYGEKNENIIQLKDVSAYEYDETIKLKEGEIAIIGGFVHKKTTSLKNGLPYTDGDDSAFDTLTSTKENNVETIETVITITAKII